MASLKRILGLAACLALFGFAGATPARAQYFGQNKVQYRSYDWKAVHSPHFDVYFYSGEDSLALRVMDLAEKTSVMLSERMGHALEHKVPIILYGSHNDFAQTNISPELIEGNTGGFTEALRNRVVLPFNGSYEDLRHVVVHELTHAVMFDLLYEGNAAALLARQSFFSVPLWFAEGLAEYMSLGMESNAEMYLRDGTIEGYLPPLEYSGGYIVYKQGQSAISYLVDRYGEERLRDVLQRIRASRNFDRAFERSMGTTVMKFDIQWREWLRKEYWPTVASKEEPARFGKRLTDHRHDTSHFNTGPAVSPQGDRIAYFTDRKQYSDVYVMSALDGKVTHRVIRGERNVMFESIPAFNGTLTWSPDGDRLALTAKSGGTDVLYEVNAENGRIVRRYQLPCEALFYPTWSPVSDTIAVVGVHDGRSDIYLVSTRDGAVRRVTNDAYAEKEPCWSPDGRQLAFSSDRIAPVVLHPQRQEKGYGSYGIFALTLSDGSVRQLVDTYGDDQYPAWSPDGRSVAFISDRNGTPNIYLMDARDSSVTQLTDVRGGVLSLSWSRENDRLVFSAYEQYGFDIFAVREPLSVEGVLDRLKKQTPSAVLTPAQALTSGVVVHVEPDPRGALAAVKPDSMTVSPDSTTARSGRGGRPVEHEPAFEPGAGEARPGEPQAWGGGDHVPDFPSRSDSALKPLPDVALFERGGPFAISDSVLAQRPSAYRARLSPDYAGAAFYAATGYGYGGTTQFQFSDFLGDHNLQVTTDILSNSLQDLNAFVFYRYLPRRWDLGLGAFHYNNYYASNVSTLGEELGGLRRYSERNFGAIGALAYPFNRFQRVEFNFTQMFLERRFFEEDFLGSLVQTSKEYRSVTSPGVALVGDNVLGGYYGPANGQRFNLTYSPSFPVFDNGLSYQTVTLDARRYWDLTSGYTFAQRLLLGASDGRDAQLFRVGGFSTLRGYPDYSLVGTRVAIVNTELRFPFIDQLGMVGPLPLGLFNLRGAVFLDAGMVWSEGVGLRFSQQVQGGRVLVDPKVGFGTGVRSSFLFMILKLDVGWNTEFQNISRPRWHFSIGPEF